MGTAAPADLVWQANVIAGNGQSGVYIGGSSTLTERNVVASNYIGTNSNGNANLGNTEDGVLLSGNVTFNAIGVDWENFGQLNGWNGVQLAQGNGISGNGSNGVEIQGTDASRNDVSGNSIGLFPLASGSYIKLANAQNGVSIDGGASQNMIGSDGDPARYRTPGQIISNLANVIGGNGGAGVHIGDLGTATNGNVVAVNYIGTDTTGNRNIGNVGDGVLIDGYAQANWIGMNGQFGATPEISQANDISGNGANGVEISGPNATNNTVACDYIGDPNSQLGNLGNGVLISGMGNTIGWAQSPGGSNGSFICFNGGDGVRVAGGDRNAIVGNSDYSNTGLAINLVGQASADVENSYGVTSDDPMQSNSAGGPNDFQNFPVIDSISPELDAGGDPVPGYETVTGTLNSTPGQRFRIELYTNASGNPSFFGQGQTFLIAADTSPTDGNGNVSFTANLPASRWCGLRYSHGNARDLDWRRTHGLRQHLGV